MAEEALEFITRSMVPGAHLADAFPVRECVCPLSFSHNKRASLVKPLHSWFFAKKVQHDKDMVQHLLSKPIQHVKTQMVYALSAS